MLQSGNTKGKRQHSAIQICDLTKNLTGIFVMGPILIVSDRRLNKIKYLSLLHLSEVVQGLFVPFARVGSGAPVRVLSCKHT